VGRRRSGLVVLAGVDLSPWVDTYSGSQGWLWLGWRSRAKLVPSELKRFEGMVAQPNPQKVPLVLYGQEREVILYGYHESPPTRRHPRWSGSLTLVGPRG